MNIDRFTEITSARGASFKVSEVNKKTFEYTLTECRKYINERSDQYRNLDEGRRDKIKELILRFVNNAKYLVEGYETEDNKLDAAKLIEALTDNIQNYGILTEAMNDPDIFEIRGNGKEIWVEQGGRCQQLRDSSGNIVRFESAEQQETILRKMLGDVRLSPKDAIVNARTVEGYRLAVVHSSATGDDPEVDVSEDKYPGVKNNVMESFQKILTFENDISTSLNECEVCGEPTSSRVCKACELKDLIS